MICSGTSVWPIVCGTVRFATRESVDAVQLVATSSSTSPTIPDPHVGMFA